MLLWYRLFQSFLIIWSAIVTYATEQADWFDISYKRTSLQIGCEDLSVTLQDKQSGWQLSYRPQWLLLYLFLDYYWDTYTHSGYNTGETTPYLLLVLHNL